MKRVFTLLLTILPCYLFSQDLTGTWEGRGGGVTYIKMVIKHKGDSIYGYTYDEGGGYCLASFAARYKRERKNLVGRGTRILRNSGTHVLASYDLTYSKSGNVEYLRERDGLSLIEKLLDETPLTLRKISNKTAMPGPPNKPAVKKPAPKTTTTTTVAKPKPAAPITSRTTVKPPVTKPAATRSKVQQTTATGPKPVASTPPVTKTVPLIIKPAPASVVVRKNERASKLVDKIYTTADTIKMQVYDNGEVDGDTVTIFFNNAVILDRYRISEKAREILLPVARTGEHYIELFANNLGTIPPNTALIIITAGTKRYELRASYDLNTNARIIIEYKD